MMPYGDANAIVVEMAAEVLPIVRETPVLAGVCGTDPFRLMPVFLRQLREIGFTGVQNFPTVGLIDGLFRQNLEETGMGYGLEVEMIRAAQRARPADVPVRVHRGRGDGDGRGGRRRARAAHGPDDEGDDRRAHGEDARRERRARPGDARRGEGGEPRRSWCSATAGRSPSRRTPPTSSSGRAGSSASSARPAWSGCRPRWR